MGPIVLDGGFKEKKRIGWRGAERVRKWEIKPMSIFFSVRRRQVCVDQYGS